MNGLRLGIIGGGQLAKMTAQAAAQLGFKVVVIEKQADCPANLVSTETLVGDWSKPEELLKLGALVDVVTLENEFVEVSALRALEAQGHKLWPSAETMSRIQDKFHQKEIVSKAGLPVPRMCPVADLEQLSNAGREFGYPFVLKARRNAYDGKGNATVRSAQELEAAWEKLGGSRGNALYAEQFCPFVKELAVIVTRSLDGEAVVYPVVETIQRDHICHVVQAPGAVPAEVATRAAEVAKRAVTAVGGVGSFGVEMFLTSDGQILVNELAPRVHNSGHYTIEGCVCSQFENHVRAVTGLPLGSAKMVAPAAVMVNLLGMDKGSGYPTGINNALAVAGAHVHVYGKLSSGAGRKMGHVTALGETMEEALARAQKAAGQMTFGGKE